MNSRIKSALQWMGMLSVVRSASRYVSREQRQAHRQRVNDYQRLEVGTRNYSNYLFNDQGQKSLSVLIEAQTEVAHVLLQSSILHAYRICGYRPVVLLRYREPTIRKVYELLGVRDFVYLEEQGHFVRYGEAVRIVDSMHDGKELLAHQWNGILVGQHTLSTLMRMKRRGSFNFHDAHDREAITNVLWSAISSAHSAQRIIDKLQPVSVLLLDRGYTPSGEVFDAAINSGIKVVTWNAAHRDSALILKRYDKSNSDVHPVSLSNDTWNRIKSINWSTKHWALLKHEIENCYHTGQWYGEVGTQFNTAHVAENELARYLKLDPTKKIAVVFSHIFWDGTFFWGHDLFDNYEQWFIETVKTACANDSLNWIIKVHPANIVKDRRDGVRGEPLELLAIRDQIGNLPAHVKIMDAGTNISTLSVIKSMDFCITVRGTVGIESAVFGKNVLTAGTGRYDRMGFTIDSDSREEYLHLLSTLHEQLPPNNEQIELARRFAYGIFLARPVSMTTFGFSYRKDEKATLDLSFQIPSDEKLRVAKDLQSVANWLCGDEQDYLDSNYLV